MTHDAAHVMALILSSGYAFTVAASPQVPMSDERVLVVSIGAGMIGGLVAALLGDSPLTKRKLGAMMLSSGMASGAMVAGAIIYLVPEPRLLAVGGLALTAGIIAWPISQLLPKLAPSVLRDTLKSWAKTWIGGSDK